MSINKYLIKNHCYTNQFDFEHWLKNEINRDIYFDGDDMVDADSDKTIATFEQKNVTYNDALMEAKKYYGIA